MLPKLMRSDELKLEDVPSQNAEWQEISRFAIAFNGYVWAGTTERLVAVAESCRDQFKRNGSVCPAYLSLDELRAGLFAEQRRFHHLCTDPKPDELLYIRQLVVWIRDKARDN